MKLVDKIKIYNNDIIAIRTDTMSSDLEIRWINAHSTAILVLILILRVGFLLVNNLGLIGDESYYWDWSRQPDWCYFSKPPMVAWLIGIFTWLFGDNITAIRLPSVVLGTIFLWYFHKTAQAFYGNKSAVIALLIILATPNNVLANIIMTIDPPVYCFWMISLYYLRQALFDLDARSWLWAGFAGAAALLSKQVALVLPMMLLIYILQDRNQHGLLKRKFIIYLLPIIVVSITLLFWNYQHDWVMFNHSQAHFITPKPATVTAIFKYTPELFFYQLLLISPLIFVMVIIRSLHLVARFNKLPAEERFLVLMGPALLVAVFILSAVQKVQGNWPMPFYFTALISLSGCWQKLYWRRLIKYGLSIGYIMVLITYTLPFFLRIVNLQDTENDPTRRFKYWQELAENIQYERQIALPSQNNTFIIAIGHRYLASQLAFYLPDHPHVYRYEASGEVKSQYEIWSGPSKFFGRTGIIVSDEIENVPEEIKSAFQHFTFLVKIPNPMHSDSPYFLFLGENLINWPIKPYHYTQLTPSKSIALN